jgi:transcriptional regulator with XRE-family HTH domain
MTGMMEGMTLQELLNTYGIHRPSDLAHAAGIDRRHAWLIWHGKNRIGATLALRLYESKGIPIHELLRAAAEPDPRHPPPKGRPRKRKDNHPRDADDPEVQLGA